MGKEKKYKIRFYKKIGFPSNPISTFISDFCKTYGITIEDLSINNFPKKSYIKVKCSRELYESLIYQFLHSDLKQWTDLILLI